MSEIHTVQIGKSWQARKGDYWTGLYPTPEQAVAVIERREQEEPR